MILTYCGLRHFALRCLQKNVLSYRLVTSTLQCIPLYHKMSGDEGKISVVVTVC
jgi:hypothetical protein